MNLIRSFFIAFSMYSKIPMPRTDWTKESMRYAMCFFPVIGAVIGGLLYLWIYLTGDSTGSLFRAAVAVLIPIIITGGIHLDGLLDTTDALSSYKSMEEKLRFSRIPTQEPSRSSWAAPGLFWLWEPGPRCALK